MRYSIEPRDRIYVKGYEFLSFAKSMGKNLSNKYGQKRLDSAKKIYNRCNKNCFKKSNSKKSRSNCWFNWQYFADKITSVSTELHSKKFSTDLHSKNDDANSKVEVPKKNISSEKRQQIIDELILV